MEGTAECARGFIVELSGEKERECETMQQGEALILKGGNLGARQCSGLVFLG